MRILLVEDAPRLSKQVVKGLSREGHQVERVANGRDALSFATRMTYDVIVLDVMLPAMDGFEVLEALRDREIRTPVLMLTALDSMDAIVRGLDSGADDYLTKPFIFTELCARLRAVSRRGLICRDVELRVDSLVLNTSTREVCRNGREIRLTKLEFALLEALMKKDGRIMTRDELARVGWSDQGDVSTNSMDVILHHLRRKVTANGESEIITTVRGVGYAARPPFTE
ncbi:response regulator transcription factor [Terriglobus sp. 2YAB30_2]|uniref:response regulator transcription factor n=1 Tax=unclassified Terriglobus TaxID=2628988 RepID=UPI003F9D202E